jgi:hypothetical protein
MWMRGAVPLSYDVIDKTLVVNSVEATSIQTIFPEYLALGLVRQLSARLDELGFDSKQRTNRHGRVSGGTFFSRGALYNILRTPIYIGKLWQKEKLHEGMHKAIIDDATWKRVQTQLADLGGKKIGSTTNKTCSGRHSIRRKRSGNANNLRQQVNPHRWAKSEEAILLLYASSVWLRR